MSYTCRSSPVKNKKLHSKQSPFNLLHHGIKRKVLKQEYTKIFTKIKVDSKYRIQSSAVFNYVQVQKSLDEENKRIRTQIKRIEAENGNLKSKINKQNKLQNMMIKKTQNQEIAQLSLQKALEIKLLVQSQCLQEINKEKTLMIERFKNQQQTKEQNIGKTNDQNCLDLYAIINESADDFKKTLNRKDQNFQNNQDQLFKLRENIQKIKISKQQINQQIFFLNMMIQKVKSHLPIESKIKDEKDNGIFGVHSRLMMTSSIQKDISCINSQNTALQKDIQQLMERKIKDKLQILNVINYIKNEIIKIKHFQVWSLIRR